LFGILKFSSILYCHGQITAAKVTRSLNYLRHFLWSATHSAKAVAGICKHCMDPSCLQKSVTFGASAAKGCSMGLFIYLFIGFIMQVKPALRAYGQQVPKV